LSDLGYSFSKAAIVAGSLTAVAILTVGEFGVYKIDEALFGPEPNMETGLRDAGLAVATLFLVSNGFLGPVVEEYVWRGMVQRGFGVAWGPVGAVIVTALLFTAKHIVTDLSFVRTAQLLFFSFLVGCVAFR
jgi:membrane protease YdiL (CAAX protease family)